MNNGKLIYEDLRLIAELLRKYATAVEDKLYMNMKVDEARFEIEEADRLAEEIDVIADELDTVCPPCPNEPIDIE